MRKLLLAFLLPFVLLFAQQGVVAHELGHLAQAASTHPASHTPGDLQCAACLAFAHLGGLATVQAVAPALLSFGFQCAAVDLPPFIATDAPSARSRGPPAVL